MPEEAFDVVVVGGGAAGCVSPRGSRGNVRARSSCSRLGPTGGGTFRAICGTVGRSSASLFDWGYKSEPHAGGEVEARRRKRLLGGTSWLTRFTPRGSPADYDGWVGLGLAGWGWGEVLPYFVKLENDVDFGDRALARRRGPIPSSRQLDSTSRTSVSRGLDALDAAGFPWVDDHNQPGAVGAGRMPMNVLDGERVTTADAYLPLHATPPNLTVRAVALSIASSSTAPVRWRPAREAVSRSGPCRALRRRLRQSRDPASLGDRPGWPARRLPAVGANLADHPSVYVDFRLPRCGSREPALHAIATFHSSGRPTEETPDLMLWLADPIEEDLAFGAEVVLLRPRSRGIRPPAFERSARSTADRVAEPRRSL